MRPQKRYTNYKVRLDIIMKEAFTTGPIFSICQILMFFYNRLFRVNSAAYFELLNNKTIKKKLKVVKKDIAL